MTLAFIVYLLGLLPKISSVIFIVAVATLIISFILLLTLPVWVDDYLNETKSAIKKVLWIPALTLVIYLVIPSEKTAYYMIAAYGTEKLVENPTAQILASDGVDVLKELLARAKRELASDQESVKTK